MGTITFETPYRGFRRDMAQLRALQKAVDNYHDGEHEVSWYWLLFWAYCGGRL